ncbi:MAG TPA: nitroreductase family protein [Lachnospiraceae bacterium]|nr:nitroreductase family protein [Lachnospiraceae bacterium]
MSIKEAMQVRKSVRKYEKVNVNDDLINRVKKDLDEYTNVIYDTKIRFVVLRDMDQAKNTKLGFLWGLGKIDAPCCIVGIYEDKAKGMAEIGFALEREVLKITEAGYGSCWLGTFNEKTFSQICNCTGKEHVGIVVVFGAAKGSSFMNTNFRKIAGSTKRKDISEICLNQIDATLDEKVIDMIKYSILAPSAVNFQPVRIGIDGNRADFYLASDSMVDVGIFMSHFYLCLKELSHNVQVIVEEPKQKCYTVKDGMTYIASIRYE